MPKLQVPNGVQIRLLWSIGGTPWAVNVLGARNDAQVAVTQAMADSLGTAIKGAFGTTGGIGSHIGATTTLEKVGVRNVNVVSQPEFLDAGAAVPGTSAVKTLPPQVALVITFRTALVGPDNRGRMYLGGFDEASSDGATANADTVTDALAFGNAIKNAINGVGLVHAILQRALPQRTDANGNVLPPRPANTVPITVVQMRDARWDTQRRRNN